jgi:hypothetical protein
MSLFLQSSTG